MEQREVPPPPLDAVLSHGNCSSVGPNGGALGCYLHLLLCICASGLQVGQAGATPGPSPPPGRGVPCCSLSLYLAIWDIGTNTGCGARDNVPVAYACQLSWSLCPVPILLDPSSGPVFRDPALLTLVPRTSLFVSRQSRACGVLPYLRSTFRTPASWPSRIEVEFQHWLSLGLWF